MKGEVYDNPLSANNCGRMAARSRGLFLTAHQPDIYTAIVQPLDQKLEETDSNERPATDPTRLGR